MWCVLVLTNRGLYAHWLYHAITHLGWHPFMRINAGGKYHRFGLGDFLPLANLIQPTGQLWYKTVTYFKAIPWPTPCWPATMHSIQTPA